jgi:hypothetical protein
VSLVVVIAVLPSARIKPQLLGVREEGVEPDEDWAVLRAEPPPELLPAITIGRSSDLEVGWPAVAVDNPFAIEWTLATSVVGGSGRHVESVTGRPLMEGQTDKTISPGVCPEFCLSGGGRDSILLRRKCTG